MNEPVVVVRQPGRQPLFVEVHGRLELGRDCDGLLLADPQVSRRHAEVRVVGDRVLMVDLASTNGTYVGVDRLSEPVELRPGIVARLGATTVEIAPFPADSRAVSDPFSVRATTVTGPQDTDGVVENLRRTSIDAIADAATVDDWRLVPLPQDGGTVTIVFSDIEASTELANALGDRAWYGVLERHNRIVRQELRRFDGFEVKAQGDGFMLTFPSARRAVQFAIASQRALAQAKNGDGVERVRIRIGMHTGEAIIDRSGDLIGAHVNLAARVGNAAAGGEILVSSLVHEIVAARGDIVFETPRAVRLKGITGEHLVYPVEWRSPDTAQHADP